MNSLGGPDTTEASFAMTSEPPEKTEQDTIITPVMVDSEKDDFKNLLKICRPTECSGNGAVASGSEVPQLQDATISSPNYYEFLIPKTLVGRLIGRQGVQIRQLQQASGCRIQIKQLPPHIPYNYSLQSCLINGEPSMIPVAINEIRKIFPTEDFPQLAMTRVSFPTTENSSRATSECSTATEPKSQSASPDIADSGKDDSVLTTEPPSGHSAEDSDDSGHGATASVHAPPHRVNHIPRGLERIGRPTDYYEFLIPRELTGRIIGKQGNQIKQLQNLSNCSIRVKQLPPHIPHNDSVQSCVIEGDPSWIQVAIKEIRKLFPTDEFPQLSMARLGRPEITTLEHLVLPSNEISDVIVSHVMSIGHMFVQLPYSPTFPLLKDFEMNMNNYYNTNAVPPLVNLFAPGVACCAPYNGRWYRSQIVEYHPATQNVSLRVLDHGGYIEVPYTNLRQLTRDLVEYPFQSAEVYLVNFTTIGANFSPESARYFMETIKGHVLKLNVTNYSDDGRPFVELYKMENNRSIYLNLELCKQGFAKWAQQA